MNWASRLTGRLSFSISMVPRSAAFVNGGGKMLTAPAHGLCGSAGGLPSQSRLAPCQLPQRGSQVSPPPLGEVSCQRHDGEGFSSSPRRARALMVRSGASAACRPLARFVPCGHAPRIENPGTGPRTCAILSMSTSDSELPLARIVPCGHAPRIDSGGTPHQFSFLLLMIFDSSSMKLLISLNCRYTEANRT